MTDKPNRFQETEESERPARPPATSVAAPTNRFADDPNAAPPVTAAPARTWGDTLRGAGQTALDFAAAAGSSGTFGMDVRRDALAGWIAGDYPSYSAGVEAEQKRLEKHRERSPIASVAGDVAGAVALPGMGGAGLAARGIKAGAAPWLARAGGYGIEGAGVGAGQAAGTTYSGVPSDYLKNALTGGAIGFGLGGTIGGAFGPRNPGPRTTAVTPPSGQTQRVADYAYDALRASPAQYEAPAARQLGDRVAQRIQHYDPVYAPTSTRAVERLRGFDNWPTSQTVTPAQFDLVRQSINEIPAIASKDRSAGRIVKTMIDDFLAAPPPGAVRSGFQREAAEAARIARNATDLHAGAARARAIENLQTSAKNATGREGSLAERQASKLATFMDPATAAGRNRMRGFNAAEREAFQDVITPSGRQNFLKSAGDLLSGSNAPGGPAATAAVLGGLGGGAGYYFKDSPVVGTAAGLAVPIAGALMKGGANRMSAKSFDRALDLVRQRNPLYAHRVANAPVLSPGKHGSQMLRDAMTAGLIAQGFGQVDSVEDEPLRITVNPRR